MYEELLRQAERLARLDPKKPRQVNLRRAVSAAYYSLFHHLVDEATRNLIGTAHEQTAFRQVVGRAFSHATMKSACRSFSGGSLPASVAKGLPKTFRISTDLRVVAQEFLVLQDLRHSADYDLTETFYRAEVLGLVQRVESAIQRFRTLPDKTEKRFFLACLLTWNTLSGR